MKDYGVAYGLKYIWLRYFNVAGCDKLLRTGEWHEPETHLIPNILKSTVDKTKNFKIYGDDYDTPDGTCIRDYVNVEDLAQAHKLAYDYLLDTNSSNVFNLGTAQGNSVKNIFDTCEKVLGEKIPVEIVARREGDTAKLYANANKAKEILAMIYTYYFTELEDLPDVEPEIVKDAERAYKEIQTQSKESEDDKIKESNIIVVPQAPWYKKLFSWLKIK
mgnify:CR=1 FL=1